jgi:hypothetical protein
MIKVYSRHKLPHGLMCQTIFAAVLTVSAVAGFPAGLSAEHDALLAQRERATIKSAGTVATTTQEFVTGQFDAAAFSDWKTLSIIGASHQ